MVKKMPSESQILLFRSKLAKVSVWHKISLLAYTEVSIHCKCIFNGCDIVSYHRGLWSMSNKKGNLMKKFEKTTKVSVWHLCLHKHILAITFYDWEIMSNKHIFPTSRNQLVVCDEFEQCRIILTTISRPGDGRVTH